MEKIKARRVEPSVPVTDIRFSYQRGADVQATWRKFGWVPPSESKTPPVIVERMEQHDWDHPMRRVK